MPSTSGRCRCGAVQYKFDPDTVLWRGHCHCESCRRATGAGVATWFGVKKSGWRWTGKPPARYQSSPWARRYFCPTCGSPLAFETDRLPEEIHGLAASLTDSSGFQAQAHFYHAEHVPWLDIADDLPRYADGGKTLETAKRPKGR